ncbi:PucR family transcriptional regulator [Bacillus rubiinfantis]|uniref:PucR family transcriptional regulator n=1 Tax=Bacillus rubiinfantis TaxID=1499680 RepID=UPI0005A7AFBA|nr:PucR family transcriptional regulator [Bacillus rubiinfantis]
MEYRIYDLLQMKSLNHAVVLSGKNYLHNPISGVTIMEAPDIADWIKGGELILTSLYPIRTFNEVELRNFLAQLSEKGVSALVIKNHRFVEEIPAAMILEGNKLGLPIIQIPKEVPFVEVMYPVMGELFNRQVKKLQYYKEIHDRFTALSLANEGPEQIIKTLEMLIKNPVALFDRNFHCMMATEPILASFEIIEKLDFYHKTAEIKFPHYRQVVKYHDAKGQNGHQIVVPVETINHTKTYLLIGEMNKPLEELDYIALENAATSLSLELVKQFAVAEVEKKFKNDLIDDLISGRIRSMNTIYQKANVIGWDLNGAFAVVLFRLPAITNTLTSKKSSLTNHSLSIAYEVIHKHLPHDIVTSKSNFIIVLWKLNNQEQKNSDWLHKIKNAACKIQSSFKKQVKDVALQVGIGSNADTILDIPRSYLEAEEALELGQKVNGIGAITAFSELGVFRLLCNFPDVSLLQAYIPVSLKKLLSYSHANQADLLKTLRTFLDCNQNAAKTAQLLFLHYKTVAYRLDRIREITGMKFEEPEEMLSVQVGLKIVDLLEREKQTLK